MSIIYLSLLIHFLMKLPNAKTFIPDFADREDGKPDEDINIRTAQEETVNTSCNQ